MVCIVLLLIGKWMRVLVLVLCCFVLNLILKLKEVSVVNFICFVVFSLVVVKMYVIRLLYVKIVKCWLF